MKQTKIYRQTRSNHKTYLPIPENEGYTVIGAGACYKMRGYRIEIPEGVEVIEPYAFAGCEEISYIELPSTLRMIGEGAFLDCKGLREVTIPEGVEEIGALAFLNCGSRVHIRTKLPLTVPDSVKTIGKNAFSELSERGEQKPRPTFSATIRFCRGERDETYTLSEIDPYAAKEALAQVKDRPFVLLAIQDNAAVIYSYDDEISLVLPIGEKIHTETVHTVGAAYEYTDLITTYHYISDFTLIALS